MFESERKPCAKRPLRFTLGHRVRTRSLNMSSHVISVAINKAVYSFSSERLKKRLAVTEKILHLIYSYLAHSHNNVLDLFKRT